jgi:hypothetical protein
MLGATALLAVNNFGDTRSGGLAGPMGLFIIVLLAIGTVLLVRSMNSRLRRLPDSFPDPAEERSQAEIARREAEIARLDADLDLPAVDPGKPDAEGPPGVAGEPGDRR